VDRRVKCAVSQVPMISGPETLQRLIRPDIAPLLRAQIEADRRAQFGGTAPALIPVASQDPLAPCALPSRDAWDWFAAAGRAMAPAWRNEVTLRSFDWLADYDPGAGIHRIAPTPLLLIVAAEDAVTPTDLALAAFERAREPKKLVLLKGGHFDAYTAGFAEASGAAAAWFAEHLGA
jgi:hypothetical protein